MKLPDTLAEAIAALTATELDGIHDAVEVCEAGTELQDLAFIAKLLEQLGIFHGQGRVADVVWKARRALLVMAYREGLIDRSEAELPGCLPYKRRRPGNDGPSTATLLGISESNNKALNDELVSMRRQCEQLHQYINDAKRAFGDERVSGEPLDQAIGRVLEELRDARARIDDLRDLQLERELA